MQVKERDTVALPKGETMWQAIEREAAEGNELAKTFLKVRDGLKGRTLREIAKDNRRAR